VLQTGLLISVLGKLKVLVPAPIEGYEFVNTPLKPKVYKSESRIIQAGTDVEVLIQGVKFSDKTFRTFGALVEN